MKLTENTKVRVKVPKHLYEAIQAELDKKGEMEEAKKEMSHGLLQKMVDDLLAKYGETEQTKSDILIALRAKINDMLNTMHPQLKSKFREEETMEEGEDHLEEIDPKFQGAMDVLSSIPGVDKIAQIDPFLAGVTLVGMLAGGLIAAPKIEAGIKALMAKIKDPKKKSQLAKAAAGENINVGGEVAEVEEMEEALDLETLMEAVKDASKKKAEEKKKKEVEAKKKKMEDEKKKEAEAKKKAALKEDLKSYMDQQRSGKLPRIEDDFKEIGPDTKIPIGSSLVIKGRSTFFTLEKINGDKYTLSFDMDGDKFTKSRKQLEKHFLYKPSKKAFKKA